MHNFSCLWKYTSFVPFLLRKWTNYRFVGPHILHSWLIVQRYGEGKTGQNFTGIPIKKKNRKEKTSETVSYGILAGYWASNLNYPRRFEDLTYIVGKYWQRKKEKLRSFLLLSHCLIEMASPGIEHEGFIRIGRYCKVDLTYVDTGSASKKKKIRKVFFFTLTNWNGQLYNRTWRFYYRKMDLAYIQYRLAAQAIKKKKSFLFFHVDKLRWPQSWNHDERTRKILEAIFRST